MKPKRPCSIYSLFFQLEHEFILQDLLPRRAYDNLHRIVSERQAGKSVSPSSDDYDERPARYRDLVLADDWFKSGKRARKHRKTNSPLGLGFHELNQLVSKRWKKVDDETKRYLKRISEMEWEIYREQAQQASSDKCGAIDATTKEGQEKKKVKVAVKEQEELKLALDSREHEERAQVPLLSEKGRSNMNENDTRDNLPSIMTKGQCNSDSINCQHLFPTSLITPFSSKTKTPMHTYPYCFLSTPSFQQAEAAAGNGNYCRPIILDSFHRQLLQDKNNNIHQGSHQSSYKGGSISPRLHGDEQFQAITAAYPSSDVMFSNNTNNNMDSWNCFGWLCQPTTNNDLFGITPATVACHPKNQYRENENNPTAREEFLAASSFHPVDEHIHSQQWGQMHSNNRYDTKNYAQPRPRFM